MNFVLRELKEADYLSLSYHANNQKIANNLTNRFPYPYNIQDAKSFIQNCMTLYPQSIFGIEVENEICGVIGLHPKKDIYVKNLELGFWLGEKYWGKSIMTHAVGEIIPYAFESFDINRLFGKVFGSNKGSQKIFEKNGFKLEARINQSLWKWDRFEDELIYALRRSEVNL